ncbi:MAG: hypothetical protein P4M00_21190 [Azospirillaceae bacterium]|nr:hypothetical protein [Azospirillaceae bacterium]
MMGGRGDGLIGFVEWDGITILNPIKTPRPGITMTPTQSYDALLSQFSGSEKLIRYYSQYGCYHIKLSLVDDIVGEIPHAPPELGKVLSQAAVDTILSLGDNPATAEIDGALQQHGEFTRLSHEIEALCGREASERAVSLVLPFNQLRELLSSGQEARQRAAQLLTLMSTLKPGSLIEPPPEEIEAIRTFLTQLQQDLATEFQDKISEINDQVNAVFEKKIDDTRKTLKPRYRQMLDRAITRIKPETTSLRLFVRPVLSLDRENLITVILRPSNIAHVARYGAYHSPFDFEMALPYQSSLLMQRERPLWLHMVSSGSMSTWHRKMLKQVYRQAIAATAASLPHQLPLDQRPRVLGSGFNSLPRDL